IHTRPVTCDFTMHTTQWASLGGVCDRLTPLVLFLRTKRLAGSARQSYLRGVSESLPDVGPVPPGSCEKCGVDLALLLAADSVHAPASLGAPCGVGRCGGQNGGGGGDERGCDGRIHAG
ncbi:hypothetical protein RB628_20210, partial [Streptomyces sp. ADMS]|uniref:hypothetical protein n=1 Tax=Streptomyces sp. ADMS TaxID=3071415 RepID=UPI00296FC0A6